MEEIRHLTEEDREGLQKALQRSVLTALVLGAIIYFALAYQSLPSPLLTVTLFILAYYGHYWLRMALDLSRQQKVVGSGKIIRKLDLMHWHFILCQMDKRRWIPLRHKRDEFDELKKGQEIELEFGRISYHLFNLKGLSHPA